jgi:hypothetical protein
MTEDFLAEQPAPQQPHEFAERLISQLLIDLDGMLFVDREVYIDANGILRFSAEAGAMRGAIWLVLVQAALDAHRQMVDPDDDSGPPSSREVEAALLKILPRTRPQLPALRAHAARLRQYVAIAENAKEPFEAPITRAIMQLCQGYMVDDHVVSTRGLIELRALTNYLDATANLIDTQGTASPPVRVVRPDRFHDYFLRFNELAQKPASTASERAVAALSREGRISAVITRDEHPLEVAERELRAHIGGDVAIQDASLLRIKALLTFIEFLRHDAAANTRLKNPLDNAMAYDSLVAGASTAPLLTGGEFSFASIAQLAGFNMRMLREQPEKPRKH